MNIELKEITVRQLTNGYQENEEGGTATAATTTAATTTAATTTNQPKGELLFIRHGATRLNRI